jgi:FkbM family methyltransferase
MSNVIILDDEFSSSSQSLSALMEYNKKHNIEQNMEDVVFVDVGAGMPEYYSNSIIFRNIGSKIIAIEPIPSFCDLFRDKNWAVLEYAVTKDDTQTSTIFTEMRHAEHFQGLAGSAIKGTNLDSVNSPTKVYGEYEVKCMSLNSLLNKYHPEIDRIDILDIDIEGGEIEILKGFNLDKYKPKVLIVENLDPANNGYYDFYNQINYRLVSKCAHNDIVVRENN